MPRYKTPNGSIVNVPEELAAELGYTEKAPPPVKAKAKETKADGDDAGNRGGRRGTPRPTTDDE